jgi:hypothetical protein
MSNLFAPPSPSVVNVRPKPNRLDTLDKAKAYETVVAHFSDPGYQLEWHPTRPGEAPLNDKHRASAGKSGAQIGPLNDDDKMFLVSPFARTVVVAYGSADRYIVLSIAMGLDERVHHQVSESIPMLTISREIDTDRTISLSCCRFLVGTSHITSTTKQT